MLDPTLCAHMRILDNLQTATQQALMATAGSAQFSLAFSLACRRWLLDQLGQLALQQLSAAASRGQSRRAAMYDDMLYALCRNRRLIWRQGAPPETWNVLQSIRTSLDEMRAILRGFTPCLEQPGPWLDDAERSRLQHQEAGPLSSPGALAGLVGGWVRWQRGSVELDVMTHRLELSVDGSDALVGVLIDARAPLRYLGCDILIAWGTARGLMPCSGSPAIILCEATDQKIFQAILSQLPTLTAHPPQDKILNRG